MSLYDINFNNKAIEWLSPHKRLPKIVAFLQGLLSPSQYIRNKILGDYRSGRIYQPYVSGGTYGIGALVMYKQIVYQSIEDDNMDQPPSGKWIVYLPSFIGVDERILFNGHKLILEYALNKYYLTNFRQPGLLGYYYPASTPGTPTAPDTEHLQHSDIFTLNNAALVVGFVVGQTEQYCSTVAQNDILSGGYNEWGPSVYSVGDLVVYNNYLYLCIQSTAGNEIPGNVDYWKKVDAVGFTIPFLLGDRFTIYMPVAVYNATNESDIRNFVNKIIPAGIAYNIKTY